MKLIIGGSSRIAGRFVALTPDEPFVAVGRERIAEWSGPDGAERFDDFIQGNQLALSEAHIFAGVTNPRVDADEISAVNVGMPANVLSVAADRGFAVNTYGTVLESLGESTNPYVESKRRVAELVAESRSNGVDAQHIRFHTVFGAETPQPHMFLGQMLESLVTRMPFRMSSGTQLREYHHVDDLVRAIAVLSVVRDSAAVTISHGEPVRLCDIATAVFDSFDAQTLLEIGALPDPVGEVMVPLDTRTPQLVDMDFRDSIPAIVAYMTDAYNLRTNSAE